MDEGLFAVMLVIGFAAAKVLFDGIVIVEEYQFAAAVTALHGNACVGFFRVYHGQQTLDGLNVDGQAIGTLCITVVGFEVGQVFTVVCQSRLHAGFDFAAFEAGTCHFIAHAAAFVCIVGVLLHPIGTDADGIAIAVAPLPVSRGIVVDGGEAGG